MTNSTPHKINIVVTLRIEVDPAEWARNNGLVIANGKFKISDVREDIRAHVTNIVTSSVLLEESEATIN